jgi:hypothetical protein
MTTTSPAVQRRVLVELTLKRQSACHRAPHQLEHPALRLPCRFVDTLVQKEIEQGTPAGRIVIAGFSQGGAVALLCLRQPRALAAIIGVPHCFCSPAYCCTLRKFDPTVTDLSGKLIGGKC